MTDRLTLIGTGLFALMVTLGPELGSGSAAAHLATTPSLDPVEHRHIRLATTDKAVYALGATGKIRVTLRSPTHVPMAARIDADLYRDTDLLHTATVRTRLSAARDVIVELPFTASAAGERGYRVAVTVRDARGMIRDAAMTAIDVQSAPLHARFPRQCWISHWDGATDAASLIASLIAWHCNTVQSYASYYRPELAPPASLASWRSLSGLTVNRTAILAVIAAAHAANMPVGFFQGIAEAYADWPAQTVSPSLAWGSFRNRCGLSASCTAGDLDRSPRVPDNWSRYGWRADHLDFFDPCNSGWQDFLIARAIRPMMAQFGFDFWQADTVGAPVQPTFDAAGRPLDTSRCLAGLTTAAPARLGWPAVLNSVSGWGLADAARRGGQPYLYRETWDFDTPYYPGLNGGGDSVAEAQQSRDRRAIIQPAYINRTLAEQCTTRARTIGCVVNPPSALLATAMFAIAGSTWMNHADEGCIVTSVFVEGDHLSCSPALVDALLSYKAFEVAYQHLLRGDTSTSAQSCEITSGGTGSAVGAAEQVYLLGKARPGIQICHLLNLTGVSSNDWADLNGTKDFPTPLGALTIRLYYSGDRIEQGRGRLWVASPDYADGAAQPLPYTTGANASGNYVAFALPGLHYWDMVVLEHDTNVAAPRDLSVAPRRLIR